VSRVVHPRVAYCRGTTELQQQRGLQGCPRPAGAFGDDFRRHDLGGRQFDVGGDVGRQRFDNDNDNDIECDFGGKWWSDGFYQQRRGDR